MMAEHEKGLHEYNDTGPTGHAGPVPGPEAGMEPIHY
jgi:hypothetical protein